MLSISRILFIILNFYLVLFVDSTKVNNLRNTAKPLIKNKTDKSLKVRSNLDIDTLRNIEPVSSTILLDSLDNKVNNILSMPTNINIPQNDFTSNFKDFVDNYTLLLEKNYYNILSSIPWTELYEFKSCINKNCKLQKTIHSYELCLHQCQEKINKIIENSG